MDTFKASLIKEFKSVKQGNFSVEKLKKHLEEIPDKFILEKDVLLTMYQALPAISKCDDPDVKDEMLQIFKALFDHVGNYGEAVVAYFDSCSHLDAGPFGVSNFPIGRYINKIETYYGNHNDTSIEQCLEPAKLLAWTLIGNTRDCLIHFCNQSIVMQSALLNFLRYVFEHIPAVFKYNANFKSLKGSLILNAACEIVRRYSRFPQNLDTIQHMLLRMSIPRKTKQLSLIPPNLLYEEILMHIVTKDMMDFWLRIFAEFVRALKKNSIKLGWASGKMNMYNPTILCVFLIKRINMQSFSGFDSDETFKNLGDVFKAQGATFTDTIAFTACNEIDWASKYAILDFLQVPSTSYQREIPAAIYSVLSEEEKNKYVCIEDAPSSLENYLIGIFELSLIADSVPDEFIEAAVKYSQSFDVSNRIAICLHRAYNNVLSFRDGRIIEGTYRIIDKFVDVFDCKLDLGGGICTPRLIEAILKIQNCLIIGKAVVAGIYNYKTLNPSSDKALCDYRKLDKATRQLLSIFLGLANTFYSPYLDELRAALANEGTRISSSKLSVMSAVYVLLQKLTNSIFKFLENAPAEIQLVMNRLIDFSECYVRYLQKEYL